MLVALIADALAVLLFTVIGRLSHGERADPLGLATTAWPFLAGLVFGSVRSILDDARRRRRARNAFGPMSVPAGVRVWLATVIIGIAFRAASGAGVELSFVIVATVVLGVFIVGWRFLVRLVTRVRPGVTAAAGPAPTTGPDGSGRVDRSSPAADGKRRADTRTRR